jgi:hypothetical protein
MFIGAITENLKIMLSIHSLKTLEDSNNMLWNAIQWNLESFLQLQIGPKKWCYLLISTIILGELGELSTCQ